MRSALGEVPDSGRGGVWRGDTDAETEPRTYANACIQIGM